MHIDTGELLGKRIIAMLTKSPFLLLYRYSLDSDHLIFSEGDILPDAGSVPRLESHKRK